MLNFNQIAIDGPAGSGKTTIAKLVAKELGFLFINTGAMFRLVAIALKGVDLEKNEQISGKLNKIKIDQQNDRFFLNGVDQTEYANSEEIGKLASAVAKIKTVRDFLSKIQVDLASRNKVVMEGRDITTCVLVDAATKIYLRASIKSRAQRRYLQRIEAKEIADYRQIYQDIKKRDINDKTRVYCPLRKAEDAILVDTTKLTIKETVDKIVSIYKRRVNV